MTIATLTYITGAPGSGKTLMVLSEVERLRRETRRPVYYDGIDGVEFPDWIEIDDINKVHELPTGAIIVVDEAQRHWPQRSNKNPVPASVEPFATHRHRGHTFYIMTQRFTAVDHFIRGVANRHLHLIRAFGLPRARVFEWSGKVANPDDKWNRKDANAYTFWYWKWALWAPRPLALGMYKSSELHTVKSKLPMGKVLLLLLVVAGMIHGATRFEFQGIGDAKKEGQQAPSVIPNQPTQVSDAELWAAPWKERVSGHPFSAPAYDELYRPATIPRIDGCISLKTNTDEGGDTKCSCFTQQRTRITSMTIEQCEFYVANGWFDPTKSDQNEGGGIEDFGAASSGQETVASAGGEKTAASIAGSVFGF